MRASILILWPGAPPCRHPASQPGQHILSQKAQGPWQQGGLLQFEMSAIKIAECLHRGSSERGIPRDHFVQTDTQFVPLHLELPMLSADSRPKLFERSALIRGNQGQHGRQQILFFIRVMMGCRLVEVAAYGGRGLCCYRVGACALEMFKQTLERIELRLQPVVTGMQHLQGLIQGRRRADQ